MLVKIVAGKDIFELNPELRAIEEFARLTSRQMTYVALATDYKGPFRKLSTDEKKFQAAVRAGYKFEPGSTTRLDMNGRNLLAGKVGSVEAAIHVYRKLQKDDDYETLQSINVLIGQIRDFNNKPDKTAVELEKAVNLNVGKIDKLVETKKRLEEILSLREDGEPHSPQEQDDDTYIQAGVELPLLSQINEKLLQNG